MGDETPNFEGSKGYRHVTSMTIHDVDHYTPEEREKIIASYPIHERKARSSGIPTMGSGRVFPIEDEEILCKPFSIPRHYRQINGLDFGWDHPFAAVNCAWDTEGDIFYVVRTYRKREATPIIHSAAVKPWGTWIPCAWPHDGNQHDKGSGKALSVQYEDQGLYMLDEQASHEDGGYGVEAGLTDMLDRMQTGRFKVFEGNNNYMEEVRLYHRKDGKIIKLRDDLISASRYAYMMRRFAIIKPLDAARRRPRLGTVA